jgi:glycosyltransferase involved in cell wall biosynthesis
MQKISIIMPSFNQAGYINEAIDSVLNQDYENVELIVIDGGSSDGTVDILKSYGDRIAFWVSESDGGQSNALNKALSHITGALVGWMNADDYYLAGAFKAVMDASDGSPEKICFHGDTIVVDTDDVTLSRQISFPFSLKQHFHEGFHVFTQAFFVRSSVFEAGYRFQHDLHRTMDFHFFAYLGTRYSDEAFQLVPKTLGAFRSHPDQKTGEKGQEIVRAEHQQIRAEFGVPHSACLSSKFVRLFYRVRRVLWYIRRAGLPYAFEVLKQR